MHIHAHRYWCMATRVVVRKSVPRHLPAAKAAKRETLIPPQHSVGNAHDPLLLCVCVCVFPKRQLFHGSKEVRVSYVWVTH